MKSNRVIAVLAGLALGITMVPIPAMGADPIDQFVDAGDGTPLLRQGPGSGVILGLLYPDGQRTYTLTTDAQGVVTTDVREVMISDVAQEAMASATQGHGNGGDDEFPDTPGFPGACERDTFTLAGFTWDKPWLFRTTIGSTLGTDDQADFDAAARRGTYNMIKGRNTCGLHGGLTAAGAFVGHTPTHGNFVEIDGQVTCGAPDSENVLDTVDMPGGFLEALLAAFCIWTETDNGVTRAVSADLRFNNGDYKWTYDPNDPSCDGAFPPDPDRWRWDVESTITHEAGHVFGLVNLSEIEDINQTMFPGVRRCSGHFRTLGLGDLLGMRALYGAPR
jgi:hypothetical protein